MGCLAVRALDLSEDACVVWAAAPLSDISVWRNGPQEDACTCRGGSGADVFCQTGIERGSTENREASDLSRVTWGTWDSSKCAREHSYYCTCVHSSGRVATDLQAYLSEPCQTRFTHVPDTH